MYIRKGTLEDKAEVMALYASHIGEEGVTWNEHYPNEEIFEEEDVKPGNLFCLIDEENGNVIAATVSIEDDTEANKMPIWNRENEPCLHFARVCVRHGYEGRGLARQLISHVLEEMKRRGMRAARYLVGRDNLRAQAAYRPLGFTCAGEIHFYEEDYLGFEKPL